MTILAIDTSNYTLGAALVRDKTVMAEYITYLKESFRAGHACCQFIAEGLRPNTAGPYENSGGERTGFVHRCQNRCDAGKNIGMVAEASGFRCLESGGAGG